MFRAGDEPFKKLAAVDADAAEGQLVRSGVEQAAVFEKEIAAGMMVRIIDQNEMREHARVRLHCVDPVGQKAIIEVGVDVAIHHGKAVGAYQGQGLAYATRAFQRLRFG